MVSFYQGIGAALVVLPCISMGFTGRVSEVHWQSHVIDRHGSTQLQELAPGAASSLNHEEQKQTAKNTNGDVSSQWQVTFL